MHIFIFHMQGNGFFIAVSKNFTLVVFFLGGVTLVIPPFPCTPLDWQNVISYLTECYILLVHIPYITE